MKKLVGVLVCVFFLGFSYSSNAQVVKKTGHEIKKGAKKAGNETARIASSGKSRITDKVYKGKAGPNGQTIYIDDHSKYYWIDKKGHR